MLNYIETARNRVFSPRIVAGMERRNWPHLCTLAAVVGAIQTKRDMPTRRLSLLVVEDERPLARLWATELEKLVEPTLAETLEDARTKLRGRSFDVILLDLNLPDGSGLDLLSEVALRGDDTAV